ncbi:MULTISPECIES: hypothetical protein [Mycolicibacterium]|uniref:PE-PGRS family protein n=1 Tax=Mycolicibacterium senegalense TaxID=1796 RepID=A0A378W5G3_9MYCO|nr:MULTISPECIES: hypothetical protein [Mycolicibacterium]MCV7337469.1 hypothetical protein [Mycolicibacterium senegalense]MDR7289091.1 hypothetical protein [Mycolicibacterium senegalense]QZA25968.1 hypothetical protein K3U95_07880 [Mycolicibacterium senegalense]CDP84635.1 PE-PGRS family protein [Mycolicibacterium farcinogenes]SUA27340.1 PE-PGRS family protein [Mycolicibacterium senegalense]
MHVAVRSSLTAGVALVGAGAMAVTPLSPARPEPLAPTTQSVAVDLTAATNPITAWTKLVNDTFGNVTRIGGAIASDPAPVLRQLITNDVGYVTSLATALSGAVAGLATTPGAVAEALQTVIGDINAGDYHQAGLDAINVVYAVVPAAFALLGLAEMPMTITQNIADATSVGLTSLVGGLVPVLGTLQGAFVAAGDSAQAVADSVSSGNVADAVVNLINTPATLTGAVLNGYSYEFFGSQTESWGLLSYDPATFKVGTVPSFLVNLPRAIRDAIKPDPALGLAKTSGDTVTLDAAAEDTAVGAPTLGPSTRQLVRRGPIGTPAESVNKVATAVSDNVGSAVAKVKQGLKKGFTKPPKSAKPVKHAKTTKADKAGDGGNSN